MSLIPEKILSDEDIDSFISLANENADRIVGESKFKISSSNVPGIGLQIKLWIRQFEGGVATALGPFALFSSIIKSSDPISLIKDLLDAIKEVKNFFSDPLQAVLDYTVNLKIKQDSPFPIFLKHEESNSITDSQSDTIKKIIDQKNLEYVNKESFGVSNNRTGYLFDVYTLGEKKIPGDGEIIYDSEDIYRVSKAIVSTTSKGGIEVGNFLSDLSLGDPFFINSENGGLPYEVIKIVKNSENYFEIDLNRSGDPSLEKIGEIEMIYPKNFNPSIGSESSIGSNFSMDPNSPRFNPSLIQLKPFFYFDDSLGSWNIKIPLSSVLKGFPLANRISLILGNFSELSPTNPTRKYIESLEKGTGSDFSSILTAYLQGIYPNLDFSKIQKDSESGEESTETKKLEMANLAKLFEISIKDPIFFIGILLNYLKLLLLPIQFFLSTLESLIDKLTSPAKLIKMVVQVISNPIKFLCDLFAEAILSAIEPYVAPSLSSVGITYEEAKEVEEGGKIMGLKPLVSDVVCGLFNKKLRSYSPSIEVLREINSRVPVETSESNLVDSDITENRPLFPYNFSVGFGDPGPGGIYYEFPLESEKNSFFISTQDSSNLSPIPFLKSLYSGKEIEITIGGSPYAFLVENSTMGQGFFKITTLLKDSPRIRIEKYKDEKITQEELDKLESMRKSELLDLSISSVDSQIEYLKIELEKSPQKSELIGSKISVLEKTKNSLEQDKNFGTISIDNPNSTLLFLVENYLPVKLIGVWEGVKGILGVFLGTASALPSLVPSVVKSLFSRDQDSSQDELNNSSESYPISVSTSLLGDFMNKLATPGGLLPLTLITSTVEEETGEPRKSVRSVVEDLLYSTDPEDQIDFSLLQIKDEVEESGFSLRINGDSVNYSELVKRIKILIAIFYQTRNELNEETDPAKRGLIEQRRQEITSSISSSSGFYNSLCENVAEASNKLRTSCISVKNKLDSKNTSSSNIDSVLSIITPQTSLKFKNLLVGINSELKRYLSDKFNDITDSISEVRELKIGIGGILENPDTLSNNLRVREISNSNSNISDQIILKLKDFLAESKSVIDTLRFEMGSSDNPNSGLVMNSINQLEEINGVFNFYLNDLSESSFYSLSELLSSYSNTFEEQARGLSGLLEELEFIDYLINDLEIYSKNLLWDFKNNPLNYFKEDPIRISGPLVAGGENFQFQSILDLFRQNFLSEISKENIPEELPVKMETFRFYVLFDLRRASEILSNIGK